MPAFPVRELRADEWAAYRALRLRALAGAPDAFGWTVEAAREADEGYWRRYAADSAAGHSLATFVMEGADASLVATCAVRVADEADTGHVFAMWVESTERGRGLSRRLLRAAEEWARDRGLTVLRLHVTRGNHVAERLYRSAGYLPTGEEEPLREGSDRTTVELARQLGGGTAEDRRTIEP